MASIKSPDLDSIMRRSVTVSQANLTLAEIDNDIDELAMSIDVDNDDDHNENYHHRTSGLDDTFVVLGLLFSTFC